MSTTSSTSSKENISIDTSWLLSMSKRDLVRKLLKGIETGDPESAAVVSEERYIQHNPQTQEGGEGLAKLFERLSKTNPRVNVVRAFEDGNYFFGQTEYDFSTRRVGFEVFRFDETTNQAVEHWDNIQLREPKDGINSSGRSMVDGPTEPMDLDKTEENRGLVKEFTTEVYLNRALDKLSVYVDRDLIQHHPYMADGIDVLRASLEEEEGEESRPVVQYDCLHRILAEGNFVLTVCEGHLRGMHTSFYDLHRVAEKKVVEHWCTIEKVPPKSEWKNNNGKF